ncbi:tol-pal system-associated acyl-CoA thioesterase [Oceanibacterium hippocampi]|uniref:Acyl-CoA thioester hydrolase YbgC n=1 Tax=Oceanibacterium hippocampi TaxID=745714 RepID=A0A1Y5TXT2_9PROT|nr:tol-pal system-associated acyl-CoA thioesterase [Oceanibacterium hippocampi]SLN73362.1 Acyl-CoA thioester hydrolase YbgC [Oceanibacterium hippocampi]
MSGIAGMQGEICGDVHVLPLVVYWEDTDGGGIVYFANYLKFCERGRSDLLRGLGIDQREMLERTGLALVVRDCAIEYLKPARLDDGIAVHSRVLEVGGATVRAEQIVRRGAEELVRSQVRIACVDRGGRPRRLPDAIRDGLSGLMQPKRVGTA